MSVMTGAETRALVVDRTRVDEFLMAAGELPVATDSTASGTAVPPGYLFYVSAFGADTLHEEAGISFDRGLFAGLRVHTVRPVHVGDELTVRASVGKQRTVANGSTFIEINCQYDRDGEVVLRETSTVARLASQVGSQGTEAAPMYGGGVAVRGDGVVADRIQVALMASALRDPNPVHLDDDFARGLGLAGAILHGPFVIFHTVARACDGEWANVQSFDVQMRGPIAVGEPFDVEVVQREGQRRQVHATTSNGRIVAIADVLVGS
jgi:acyl dehydratase